MELRELPEFIREHYDGKIEELKDKYRKEVNQLIKSLDNTLFLGEDLQDDRIVKAVGSRQLFMKGPELEALVQEIYGNELPKDRTMFGIEIPAVFLIENSKQYAKLEEIKQGYNKEIVLLEEKGNQEIKKVQDLFNLLRNYEKEIMNIDISNLLEKEFKLKVFTAAKEGLENQLEKLKEKLMEEKIGLQNNKHLYGKLEKVIDKACKKIDLSISNICDSLKKVKETIDNEDSFEGINLTEELRAILDKYKSSSKNNKKNQDLEKRINFLIKKGSEAIINDYNNYLIKKQEAEQRIEFLNEKINATQESISESENEISKLSREIPKDEKINLIVKKHTQIQNTKESLQEKYGIIINIMEINEQSVKSN